MRHSSLRAFDALVCFSQSLFSVVVVKYPGFAGVGLSDEHPGHPFPSQGKYGGVGYQ